MHILGTAGHVDHGKSALVRALTGTDPDRWIEERLRGMTLDLGFAHLRYPDGVEAGIIDVPGHERFLHNMLAGAAGMELLLLVVAANEGPKTQTREHLAILQYLNVRKTLVVLSKSDAVDAEELAFSQELTREALIGTVAEGASFFPVSSVTGAGLDALRAAIHDALAALPRRAPEAPPYLPIDRVFALPGHGTIVTGTLMQGRIAVGDVLKLAPAGRDVRLRSLQVFGEKRERVEGGSRVAANLPGVDVAEIARGVVLSSSEFSALTDFDVRFRPLPVALGILKRRTPVRAYIGSAEILGTLIFESVPDSIGERCGRLSLRAPAVVFPGAPYVVRRRSPKTVLGGGTIATSGTASLDERDEREEDRELAAALAALALAGLPGATAASLGAVANLREDRSAALLSALVSDGRALQVAKPPGFIDAALARDVLARASESMRKRQDEMPWLLGVTSITLARALGMAEALLVRVLATFVEEGALAYRAGYYATPDFVPELSAAQRAFFDAAFGGDARAPFVPVPFAELSASIKVAKIVGLREALDTLLASGVLVKAGDDVYRAEQIAAIRSQLEAALRRDGQITMAAFRDLVQTSRKYAVPLLEFFDASGVTLRSGDVRVLRQNALRERAQT